jgi:hypothetical protein
MWVFEWLSELARGESETKLLEPTDQPWRGKARAIEGLPLPSSITAVYADKQGFETSCRHWAANQWGDRPIRRSSVFTPSWPRRSGRLVATATTTPPVGTCIRAHMLLYTTLRRDYPNTALQPQRVLTKKQCLQPHEHDSDKHSQCAKDATWERGSCS